MGTIVLQSFRTEDVPRWIQFCMNTVRTWAECQGFTYHVLGDEFLDLAPESYRRKAGEHITIITDLARLILARNCLLGGYARAVWVDADVMIINPSRLSVPQTEPFAYCREVWVSRDPSGILRLHEKINNAVCMFRSDALVHLESYIQVSAGIVSMLPTLRDHLEVGTRFLTTYGAGRFPVLPNIGLLSPVLLCAIHEGDHDTIRTLLQAHKECLYAVNLCNHFRAEPDRVGIPDEVYSDVIDRLITSRGRLLDPLALSA